MEKEKSESNTSFSSSNFEASNDEKHDRRSFIHDHNYTENQASYCNENEDHSLENFAANLSSDVKEEKGRNTPTDEDPLIGSLCIMQSVQKALEVEIQKLGVISNLPPSYQSVAGGTKPTYSSPLEFLILTLTQDVNVLERKLSDSQGILALKDAMINELETSLKRSRELPEEFRVESELESFFRQKIEIDIECLVITGMTQNFKVWELVQHNVLEELKTSSKRKAQVLNKSGIAESKTAALKNKADALGNYYGDVLGIEETFTMQRRLCKVTLCFFVQFMLLIVVFWFFCFTVVTKFCGGYVIPT